MDPIGALAVVLALVAVGTVCGVLWRWRVGRAREVNSGKVITEEQIGQRFAEKVTLVQFSTEYCTYCPATRSVLSQLAAEYQGVKHVEIDVTNDQSLANAFKVLQTPTTLLVLSSGQIRARFGGPPRRAELAETLAQLIDSAH